MLKVYVSNEFATDLKRENFLFCKIADDIVTKVIKVEHNTDPDCQKPVDFPTDDVGSVHDSGHREHILFQPEVCRTNVTIYYCRVPYLDSVLNGQTYQV